MPIIDPRTVLQKWLGFMNMASAFKFFAMRKGRRDLPFFYFEDDTYTYGQTFEQSIRAACRSVCVSGPDSGKVPVAAGKGVALRYDDKADRGGRCGAERALLDQRPPVAQ